MELQLERRDHRGGVVCQGSIPEVKIRLSFREVARSPIFEGYMGLAKLCIEGSNGYNLLCRTKT